MKRPDEISELKKSLKILKQNLDKDSKELSKIVGNTTSAMSTNFKKLNSLDLSVNTKGLQTSLDELQTKFKKTSTEMSNVFSQTRNITSELNGINGFIRNSTSPGGGASAEELPEDFLSRIIKNKFPKTAPWVDLINEIFKVPQFASGGVVPGRFSQPVPVMAHGSEMVLNPGQQANLFKMLNGQAGSKQEPNYVYAPQISTGASAGEVFDILNRHSRQFFSMVAEGVQTDTNLRNAVRSTQ